MLCFPIEVKHGLDGATFTIQVQESDKVSDAKRLINDHTGIAHKLQCLLLRDVALEEDDKRLVDYGLQADSSLTLVRQSVPEGVYRYEKFAQHGGDDTTIIVLAVQSDGSFLMTYETQTESDFNDQLATIKLGAGHWDSETMDFDWRVDTTEGTRIYSSLGGTRYHVHLKDGANLIEDEIRYDGKVLLKKPYESLEDVIGKIKGTMKARLSFWPEAGFSGLALQVEEKAAEQDQRDAKAAASARKEKAERAAKAAEDKAERDLRDSTRKSNMEAKFPELAAVLDQALQAGLTDMEAIQTMYRNIDGGRFTAEHYLSLWRKRLPEN